LTQVIAWLALLILGLGLPRWAVVCNKPCCEGHVKLARSCGATAKVAGKAATKAAAEKVERAAVSKPKSRCACCAARDQRPTPGTPAHLPAHCNECEHASLGVELAELSRDVWPVLTALALPVGERPAIALVATTTTRSHPPATGPPPLPRTLRERATIELLL
jgi:hypothetical protein